MLIQLCLALALRAASPLFDSVGWTALPPATTEDLELRAAAQDVGRLCALAASRAAKGDEPGAAAAWKAVLDLDPENAPAHKALRHHLYDGRWFETYSALSAYQRDEARRMRAEKGLVRHGEAWVPERDLPFLRMGWKRADDGSWLRPGDAERLAREAAYRAEGREQQDLVWVKPDEFDAWRAGRWKCGDEWLDTPQADAWHAALDRPWQILGEHFLVTSTAPRETVRSAAWHADRTHAELARLFGLQPAARPEIVVLRSLEQYNTFAGGDGVSRQPTEQTGHSSIHFAFFAESRFDAATTPPVWNGAGVACWDASEPQLAPYGLHAVRHAAALAYVDAIDPSWNTVAATIAGDHPLLPAAEFWSEKRIPAWVRLGAASYVERYFVDREVPDGGDPLWARKWALANLARQGGLEPLEKVFACELDAADPATSGRRIAEAGLVVAFVLDGPCGLVADAHADWKQALAEGGDLAVATRALTAAIAANEAKLRAFAGL